MRNEYEKIYAKLKEQAPHRNYEWFQAYGKPGMKNGLMVFLNFRFHILKKLKIQSELQFPVATQVV